MKLLKPKFWSKNQISLFSILLFPIALLIKLIIFLKPFFIKKYNFSIPVICVGNIYLGGTGKTPLSIEIFTFLKNMNKNPAFIRKKYSTFQDEINLLSQIGPVYQEGKRTNAINNAIQNNFDVAILDDGFQDFSVNKNLSIVCFNEKQWIGNGFIIPSGPLREELSALKRTDCVMINGKKNSEIEKIILKENKKIRIYYSKYIAVNISDFKNKKAIAFAGIGNPNNFFDLLKENNVKIVEKISFPDHYNYSYKELKDLENRAKENDAILLTSEKDFFRINENHRKNIGYLKIKIEIENQNKFIEEIKRVI